MLHCIVFGREIKVGVSLGEFGCLFKGQKNATVSWHTPNRVNIK